MTSSSYAALQHLHMPPVIFFNPNRINKIGHVISTTRGPSTFNAPNKNVRPIKAIRTPGTLWQGQPHLLSDVCMAGSFHGVTADGLLHPILPTQRQADKNTPGAKALPSYFFARIAIDRREFKTWALTSAFFGLVDMTNSHTYRVPLPNPWIIDRFPRVGSVRLSVNSK